VNELKDSATQIEEEIDKTKNSLHKHKIDVARLRDQLGRMDKNHPNYVNNFMYNFRISPTVNLNEICI